MDDSQRSLTELDRIAAAALTMLDECHDALLDNAERFTCSEADAVCVLMEATGHEDWAVTFLAAHREGDEHTDPHGEPSD